jgi:hypothetical protein
MRDPGYDSRELGTVGAGLLPPVVRGATLADQSLC